MHTVLVHLYDYDNQEEKGGEKRIVCALLCLTVVLDFHCVPHVNRIVVAAGQQKPTGHGQAARCETRSGVGRLVHGDLLIRPGVVQTRGFVLRSGRESIAAVVEL